MPLSSLPPPLRILIPPEEGWEEPTRARVLCVEMRLLGTILFLGSRRTDGAPRANTEGALLSRRREVRAAFPEQACRADGGGEGAEAKQRKSKSTRTRRIQEHHCGVADGKVAFVFARRAIPVRSTSGRSSCDGSSARCARNATKAGERTRSAGTENKTLGGGALIDDDCTADSMNQN